MKRLNGRIWLSINLSMAMQGSLYLCKTFRASNLNGVSLVFNKTPFHLPFSICLDYALMQTPFIVNSFMKALWRRPKKAFVCLK